MTSVACAINMPHSAAKFHMFAKERMREILIFRNGDHPQVEFGMILIK